MFGWLRRLFKPPHTLRSAIETLVTGLKDGSITLNEESTLFQALCALNVTAELSNTPDGCEAISNSAAGVLGEFHKRQSAGVFGVTDSEWLALTDPRVRQMLLSGGCAEAYRLGMNRMEVFKIIHEGVGTRPRNGVMH